METYRGQCHCGAVSFTVQCPLIDRGLTCNCSICRRKGAVMSTDYYSPQQITVAGLDSCSIYRWGDHDVDHYFCANCGVYPFHQSTHKPGHLRINLGCIEGLKLSELIIDSFDGRNLL